MQRYCHNKIKKHYWMAPIKAWLVINACDRDCDKGLDNNNNKYSCLLCQCKVKVKVTLVQALRLCRPYGP